TDRQSAAASLSTFDRVNVNRPIKTFKRDFSQRTKHQSLPEAQFGYHARDQDLIGLGVGTKPRRQLHGGSKDIVTTLDRLTGRATNPDFDVMIVYLPLTLSQLTLDLHCATDRGRG